MILVLDIDDTLADLSHRAHIVEKPEPTQDDWDMFFDPELVAKDAPIEKAQIVFDQLVGAFDTVIFVTGRPDYLRDVTVAWLKKHFGVAPKEDALFMRPANTTDSSSKVKKRLMEDEVTDRYSKDNDFFFIDDEPNNIDMFKDYGVALKAPECWDVLMEEFGLEKKAMRFFAKLTEPQLQRVYELTYKYGWLVSFERQEGWLEDRANVEKLRIESEMGTSITQALDEIGREYADWLQFHTPDGWKAALLASDNMNILVNFAVWDIPMWWALLSNALMDVLPPEKQKEYHALLFDLQLGQTSGDMVKNLLDTFPNEIDQILRQTSFLDVAYTQYLKRMEGLAATIPKLNRVYQDVQSALQSNDLQNQIITFQYALTTAHSTGDMSDYILGLPAGEGKVVLDRLSSGEHKQEWDKDLEQVLGRKLASLKKKNQSRVTEVPVQAVNPLHEVRDEKKLDELVRNIKAHGWVGRPLIVEEFGEGYQAWTGSHRLIAAKQAGLEKVPVIVIDYAKVVKALEKWGYTPEELKHGIGDSIIDDTDRHELLVEAGDVEAAQLMYQEVLSNTLQEIVYSARDLKRAFKRKLN